MVNSVDKICRPILSETLLYKIIGHLLYFDDYLLILPQNILFYSFKLHCGGRYNEYHAGLGGSLDAPSDWRPGGRGFNPRRGRQHSFMEIDHEIFSTVILSLPLIQEGQLSVSGERMCTILVNRLED